MSKKILTLVVLAAGVEAIAKVVTTGNPEDLAAEIFEMYNEATANNEKLIKAEADLKDTLELNAKHEQTIIELSSAKTAKPTDAAKEDAPTFKLDGKTYGFEIPVVNFKGQRITAEQVCADKSLQKQLIERVSGMLKEIAPVAKTVE